MAIEKHGFTLTEKPMSPQAARPPAYSTPVFVGTAPVNLLNDPSSALNVPVLARSYDEAVAAFGFSYDFENFTLSEAIHSHFELHKLGSPIVLINVLDPAVHTEVVAASVKPIIKKTVTIEEQGVLRNSLVVKSADAASTYTLGTDYGVKFDANGQIVISVLGSGTIPADANSLSVAFSKLDASGVTGTDIIGGTDDETGIRSGLDLLEEVFPRFQHAPTYLAAPGYSQEPMVAAAMVRNSQSLNGMFRVRAVTDLDASVRWNAIAQWKQDNGYRDERQINTYPMAVRSGRRYRMSTLYTGAACATDASNDGVPAESASNKPLMADAIIYSDGTEMVIGKSIADEINAEGIVTAINFTGTIVAWGNRTGAFPDFRDPQRGFIPVRGMFDWVENNFAIQFWSKVDDMMNTRVVQEVTDGANIWLNGLVASGYLLGGRVEFLETENPIADLMQGKARFHFFITPPGPFQEIEGIFEYDTSYMNAFFGA
ncbi:phage tail sheath family protein [Paenibacillus sp. UASWS1643]|uniref:phage tail sheath family protein n=1 Tax=Paenibacillus sp. UASWS1643 TaxID=2580422 RepID=UPI00123B1224|nr:phage tail sheath family protein [Paenibacillus sp. UASWS1643]KAA8750098.1 phage tail sheath family protein [Paenibacillus sp. UASWS1643]